MMVVAILVVVAAIVMIVSRESVTETVRTGERRAVRNLVELIRHNTEARWGTLLDDKVATVRNARAQLSDSGQAIDSVLENFAHMADRGLLTTEQAKEEARQWIDKLALPGERYAFVYDADFNVQASGDASMRGRNISGVRDFKGRLMADAVMRESRSSGYAFAFYDWPSKTGESTDGSRYAYFGYFRHWDWVFAVADSPKGVLQQVNMRRQQAEASVREALSKMTVARTGFVSVYHDDRRFIVPPPSPMADFLEQPGTQTGQTVREAIASDIKGDDITEMLVETPSGSWQITAVHFQPLQWTILAAVPERDLTAPARHLLSWQASIFLATLFTALGCTWLLAVRITRPLNELTTYARQLPEQELTRHYDVPANVAALPRKHRDEVGRLAESLLYMVRTLREKVKGLLTETSARERFESELNIARDIQLGLLPTPLARDVRDKVDLHAVMLAAKQVGGDLYDYFVLSDGRLCIVLGDVSDKGVPAALFMAITRTLIRSTAEDETDPARMMSRINNRLVEHNPNMMFVTLLLGALDIETGVLTWANAGHAPPVLIGGQGDVRPLVGRNGPACGVIEDAEYVSLEVQLEHDDMFVGYTDGITEAFDSEGVPYGDAQLMRVLAAAPRTAVGLTEHLITDVYTFAEGTEQSDDITLIVVHRT